LQTLERRLANRDFIANDSFSIADAYLIWALLLAGRVDNSTGEFPALMDYVKRMRARPSVRRAIEDELALLCSQR
jgi:glutathione S-transferase